MEQSRAQVTALLLPLLVAVLLLLQLVVLILITLLQKARISGAP